MATRFHRGPLCLRKTAAAQVARALATEIGKGAAHATAMGGELSRNEPIRLQAQRVSLSRTRQLGEGLSRVQYRTASGFDFCARFLNEQNRNTGEKSKGPPRQGPGPVHASRTAGKTQRNRDQGSASACQTNAPDSIALLQQTCTTSPTLFLAAPSCAAAPALHRRPCFCAVSRIRIRVLPTHVENVRPATKNVEKVRTATEDGRGAAIVVIFLSRRPKLESALTIQSSLAG